MTDDQTEWVASTIRNKLGSLPSSSEQCIYMLPEYIRKVKEECYRPAVVSIGPVYYQHPSLEAVEEYKLRFLQFFLEHKKNAYKSNIESYICAVRELEDQIRRCYSNNVHLSSSEFIEMVLVDSAFIIFYFMACFSSLPFEENYDTHIDYMIQASPEISRDLFLEENQLPFFVLEALYHRAFGTAYPQTSFFDLACVYIRKSFIVLEEATTENEITRKRVKEASNILHLVDLLRIFCLPSTPRDPHVSSSVDPGIHLYYSATELRAAGVKFDACRSNHLLNICFVDGVLSIPEFSIYESTESFYRSLIAFEQCRHIGIGDTYFTDYIFFLSRLINTPEDVNILVQNGIIDGIWLESNEVVADLFNGITKRIILFTPKFYYSNICLELNEYAGNRWNRWKGYFGPRWNEWFAILKKDYFKHPWSALSVIYAVVLLILTLLQTIGSFNGSNNHPSCNRI